jgi:uncharacterized membrane protein
VAGGHRPAVVAVGRGGGNDVSGATVRERIGGFAPPSVAQAWPLLPLALVQALLATNPDLPVGHPLLGLTTLLGLPTLVLVRRAEFATQSLPVRFCYAFGVSLLTVVLLGLALNTVLPHLGVSRPLQPAVLAIAWFVVDAGLLVWRSDVPLVPWASMGSTLHRAMYARFEPAQALAVLALIAGVIGAVRLNNGESGGVALLSQLLVAAALLALMAGHDRGPSRDARVVALVATTLLLATSLRGWGITGHDIQAEYLSFRLTDAAQHWQMNALKNAYNACLSINLLPTVISQSTGLSGVFVFKVVMQLVFALVPVMTFLLAGRFLPRVPALVAATLTMAFPTFFTDMPYLVRQEVAFFFLALLLLAVTEPLASPRWARGAAVLLGTGVVLSHYSTTYVMLLGVLLALGVMGLRSLVGRTWERFFQPDGDSPFRMVLLNPVVVVALIAISLTWAGPITHTGGHATDVARQAVNALTGRASSGPGSSDTSYSLFSHHKTTSRQRLDSFVSQTLEYRQKHLDPAQLLIRRPGPAALKPEIVPALKAPLTGPGRMLHSVGLAPDTVDAGVKVLAAALMQVLLLAGLAWLLLRRRLRSYDMPDELAYLSVGAVAALALIVVVPTLSVDYGVLRAFQQTMLVVAPIMAAGLWLLLRPLGSRLTPVVKGVTVAVPVLLLLVLGGALPMMLGGNEPRLALSSSGTYYDRFYTTDSEQQAIDWLARTDANTGYRSKVISNRNVLVKMLAATGNSAPVADRLYPTLLTRDAYVFVDPQIRLMQSSTIFYTGDVITYRYPTQVLDGRMNLVYSAPDTRIYR